jgi:hypothetical protein
MNLRLTLMMVTATVVGYTLIYSSNEWLFKGTEFAPGMAWVYLPAGVRLVCTLLFAEAGVIGILIASLLTSSLFEIFPGDPITSIGYCLISALAPYLSYRLTLRGMRLKRSLANLTTTNLVTFVLLYGLANPLLQHVWFALRGIDSYFWQGLVIMSIGDLIGSLIVVYVIKVLLYLFPPPPLPR